MPSLGKGTSSATGREVFLYAALSVNLEHATTKKPAKAKNLAHASM
jgi:hypothetical protein